MLNIEHKLQPYRLPHKSEKDYTQDMQLKIDTILDAVNVPGGDKVGKLNYLVTQYDAGRDKLSILKTKIKVGVVSSLSAIGLMFLIFWVGHIAPPNSWWFFPFFITLTVMILAIIFGTLGFLLEYKKKG